MRRLFSENKINSMIDAKIGSISGGTQLYLHTLQGSGPESSNYFLIITNSSTPITYNNIFSAFQISGKIVSTFYYTNGRHYETLLIQEEGGSLSNVYAKYFPYSYLNNSTLTWTTATAQGSFTDTVTEL